MSQTLISWNIENWMTVLLMAALGYLLVAVVAQFFLRNGSSGGGPSFSLSSNVNLAA